MSWRESRVIPDLVTPPLQWSSSLPLSVEVVFVSLPNDVISLYSANLAKPPESSVSDYICDGFRSKRVVFDHEFVY